MPRVLLDTHVLLWMLMAPDRLSERVFRLVSDRDTMLMVSAASAWEVSIKHRLGKLSNASGVVLGYVDHLRRIGADELPVTSAHALTAGAFEIDHRDPFDRMLAAQALHEGVPLVTSDPAFGALPCGTFW